jgi:hypothetical protein
MSERLYDAFEVCLSALATGVDLEACLALYPDLADELRPALQTAQRARLSAQADVPAAAMNRSRAKMLAHAGELRSKKKSFFLSGAFPRLALASLAVVLVFFLSFNGLATVSAQALPGDGLYPVKLAAENLTLRLAPSGEVRQQLADDYQQRRTEEVRSLLSSGLVRNISLEGVIDEISPNQLIVQGIPVRLNANTEVSGEMIPGRLVKLEGTTQPGGWVDADRLKLRFYEYYGDVVSIARDSWNIGGTLFTTLEGTHIDPALKVGDQVLVLVYVGDDGTLYSQAILRLPEELIQQEGFVPFDVEFVGTLDAVSSDELVVSGKTVRITDETEIKGDLTTGALVKVHALVAADGSLTAREIELDGGSFQSGEDSENEGDDDSDDDQGIDDTGDDSSEDSNDNGSDDDSDDSSDDSSSDSDDGGDDGGDDSGDDGDDSDSGGDSLDDDTDDSSSSSDDDSDDSGGDQSDDDSGGGDDSGDDSDDN